MPQKNRNPKPELRKAPIRTYSAPRNMTRSMQQTRSKSAPRTYARAPSMAREVIPRAAHQVTSIFAHRPSQNSQKLTQERFLVLMKMSFWNLIKSTLTIFKDDDYLSNWDHYIDRMYVQLGVSNFYDAVLAKMIISPLLTGGKYQEFKDIPLFIRPPPNFGGPYTLGKFVEELLKFSSGKGDAAAIRSIIGKERVIGKGFTYLQTIYRSLWPAALKTSTENKIPDFELFYAENPSKALATVCSGPLGISGLVKNIDQGFIDALNAKDFSANGNVVLFQMPGVEITLRQLVSYMATKKDVSKLYQMLNEVQGRGRNCKERIYAALKLPAYATFGVVSWRTAPLNGMTVTEFCDLYDKTPGQVLTALTKPEIGFAEFMNYVQIYSENFMSVLDCLESQEVLFGEGENKITLKMLVEYIIDHGKFKEEYTAKLREAFKVIRGRSATQIPWYAIPKYELPKVVGKGRKETYLKKIYEALKIPAIAAFYERTWQGTPLEKMSEADFSDFYDSAPAEVLTVLTERGLLQFLDFLSEHSSDFANVLDSTFATRASELYLFGTGNRRVTLSALIELMIDIRRTNQNDLGKLYAAIERTPELGRIIAKTR